MCLTQSHTPAVILHTSVSHLLQCCSAAVPTLLVLVSSYTRSDSNAAQECSDTATTRHRETQTQDIFIINRMRLVRAASVGYNGAFIEVVTIIVSTLKTLFFCHAEWHHHQQAPPAVLVTSYILDLPHLASNILCKLDFGRYLAFIPPFDCQS